MAIWKVSREIIELFAHPNADALFVAKLGSNQAVVRKDAGFKTGDVYVFIPSKSVLPPGPLLDSVKNYMKGPNQNRIGSVVLRGQASCGLIAPPGLVPDVSDVPIGQDISARLGITRYIPEIPPELVGKQAPMPYVPYKEHDVMEHGIYAADFEAGEEVIATEKIHGSQGVWFVYQEDGFKHAVSSKGNLGESRCLIFEEDNHLWKAALRTQLFTLLAENFPRAQYIQAIGEEFPCQKGNWKYGETQPCLRLFKLLVDEKVLTLDEVPAPLRHLWVPVIYRGPYDLVKLNALRGGREQVSGKELHIREGIVVEPIKERRAKDGIRLTVKMLNPDYKETGEEIS